MPSLLCLLCYSIDFLKDHISPNIPHITKPQAFLIRKDPADSKVKMWTKDRGNEPLWSGFNGPEPGEIMRS